MKRIVAYACSAVFVLTTLTGCGQTQNTAATATGTDAVEIMADNTPSQTTKTPDILGYNLLWSDEFDGPTLNTDNWNIELRDPGWTNNELQAYVDNEQNVFIKDGCLCLKAIQTEDEAGNKFYTSGKCRIILERCRRLTS